ncbi:unnamed protein product [Debaryomyces tyrocola]|nr:unnamed protein product [Debaryomyces tyrocola]
MHLNGGLTKLQDGIRLKQKNFRLKKKKNSDTGSRTRVCSVKANRASRYTISEVSMMK